MGDSLNVPVPTPVSLVVENLLNDVSYDPVTALDTHEDPSSTAQAVLLELIQHASLSATSPKTSTGGPCLRLCKFVENCTTCASPAVRQWVFSSTCYSTLTTFYLDWNEIDPHRSMKLVLDLLALLLSKNQDHEAVEQIKTATVAMLLVIVGDQASRPAAKSALKVLEHLIMKHIIDMKDIMSGYAVSLPELSGLSEMELWKSFTGRLFYWMGHQHVCPAAGKLAITCLRSLHTSRGVPDFSIKVWLSWLTTELDTNPNLLDRIKTYLFTPLFKSDRPVSFALLEILNTDSQENILNVQNLDALALLQLAALEVGKKTSLVEDANSRLTSQKSRDVIIMRESVLRRVLKHPSSEIRSLAFSLLVTSSAPTRPYSESAFGLIKEHLASLHADPDAKLRYEVLGHSKDMVRRIKAARTALARTITTSKKFTTNPEDSDERGSQYSRALLLLEQHDDFFCWYISFLRGELVLTASYPRHFSALKAIHFVLLTELSGDQVSAPVGVPAAPTAHSLIDAEYMRLLLDIIADPFEDVRDEATAILAKLPDDKLWLMSRTSLCNFNNISERQHLVEHIFQKFKSVACKTGRADHASGMAKAAELVCQLTRESRPRVMFVSSLVQALDVLISNAESDLGAAALNSPVHGIFAGLCGVWKIMSTLQHKPPAEAILRTLQEHIIVLSLQIWNIVKHVLCDDSPEGHLPEELEEVDGLDTKTLLSYSFRAVHECSNLLGALVTSVKLEQKPGTIRLGLEEFKTIGNLAFCQLSELRHRGAFTAVSQTFTTVCQCLKHVLPVDSIDSEGCVMLHAWYERALNLIFAQVATTRRSAGLPALMVGILSANAASPSFDDVIRKLQEIACRDAPDLKQDIVHLPQVHALNCIKEIFKASHLRQKANRYLAECLQLAASRLNCPVWPIRNCGLILLRSLVDSLFGTSDSKDMMENGWDGKTTRISYVRHPTLPYVMLDLLKPGLNPTHVENDTMCIERVFPVLDIIRRAGPPTVLRDELYELISLHLGSPAWHLRELAARTLCSFLLHEAWVPEVTRLVHSVRGLANRAHGVILTVKFLLAKRQAQEQATSTFLDNYFNIIHIVESTLRMEIARCRPVRAVFLDIANLYVELQYPRKQNKLVLTAMLGTSKSDIKFTVVPSWLCLIQPSTPASQNTLSVLGDRLLETYKLDHTALVIGSLAKEQPWAAHARNPKEMLTLVQNLTKVIMLVKHRDAAAVAFTELAIALDSLLSQQSRLQEPPQQLLLPSQDDLTQLWKVAFTWPAGNCNAPPALAAAAVRASGAIMAALLLLQRGKEEHVNDATDALTVWGVLMQQCGADGRDYDMRMAAAEALRTLFSVITVRNWDSSSSSASRSLLEPLLALYEALLDDDLDVRDVAARATALAMPLLQMQQNSFTTDNMVFSPADAAPVLLEALTHSYADSPAFIAIACRRLMLGRGCSPTATTATNSSANDDSNDGKNDAARAEEKECSFPSAEAQLALTIRPNIGLFVVEEQNLYVDGAREAQRWARVLRRVLEQQRQTPDRQQHQTTPGPRDPILSLQTWATRGLDALTAFAKRTRDAVLGWSTQPRAYALCVRVLLATQVVFDDCEAKRIGQKRQEEEEEEGEEELGVVLRAKVEYFITAGREADLHNMILALAESICTKESTKKESLE